MSQLNKVGDLAWCGLVVLALAKRDGIVQGFYAGTAEISEERN